MNKKELTLSLQEHHSDLSLKQVETSIDVVLDSIVGALNEERRVEIRGFGNFSRHEWGPRHARNPVTGESWRTDAVSTVHFKPGKDLRERVKDLSTADDAPS